MTMTDYKPGTVARITTSVGEFVAIRGSGSRGGWFSNHWGYTSDSMVTEVRPLVMLDIEAIDITSLVRALRRKAKTPTSLFSRLANQIEAQTQPPRIPEPGKWGVVQAATVEHGTRRHFIHVHDYVTDDRHWHHNGGRYSWAELTNPTLVREGVES